MSRTAKTFVNHFLSTSQKEQAVFRAKWMWNTVRFKKCYHDFESENYSYSFLRHMYCFTFSVLMYCASRLWFNQATENTVTWKRVSPCLGFLKRDNDAITWRGMCHPAKTCCPSFAPHIRLSRPATASVYWGIQVFIVVIFCNPRIKKKKLFTWLK